MYADIVIDISHESLDRPFQYRIPESLVGQVQPGIWVLVPFGRRNTQKKGFVLKLGTKANIDPDRIKELTEIISDDNSSDKTRIALAVWMYREYGGNLIQSLRVVMPARKNVRPKQVSFLVRTSDEKRFLDYLDLARKKELEGTRASDGGSSLQRLYFICFCQTAAKKLHQMQLKLLKKKS
mgnify:CR=1 FL=1